MVLRHLSAASRRNAVFAKSWQRGAAGKGGLAQSLKNFEEGFRRFLARYRSGVATALSVGAGQTLYGCSHGSQRRETLTSAGQRCLHGTAFKMEAWTKVYNPDQLAEVMEKEGLLKSFVDLRLFVCGSAVVPGARRAKVACGKDV